MSSKTIYVGELADEAESGWYYLHAAAGVSPAQMFRDDVDLSEPTLAKQTRRLALVQSSADPVLL